MHLPRLCAATVPVALLMGIAASAAPHGEPAAHPPTTLPTDGALPMAAVCHFRVEGGHLVLHSRYVTPEDRGRNGVPVQIEEYPGRCSVTILKDPDGSDVPRQFYLFHNTQSQPDFLLIRTHLIATSTNGGQAMHISLKRDVQTRERGWWIVTLVQGRSAQGGGALENNYEVELTTMKSGDPDSRVTYSAADWNALRQKFPAEVENYVWPIFRDLRQLSVFAVEPVVAWQVFGEWWKPDPGVADRVKAAIPGLGSDRFADREASARAIRDEGVDAALILSRVPRTGLSLQHRTAIEGLLAPYAFLTPDEAAARGKDVEFLLACLYCQDPAVRRIAATRLAAVSGKEIIFNTGDDETAREAAIESLRAKLLPESFRPIGLGPAETPAKAN